ncbi:hypothetical protein DFH94DRAFT_806460 [Russula ochroleuca]|uniref:Uncharacterized protein n=1 Tax=Russula ochroleuca TaxID=152965 RepID=A0A9P5JZW7_9AGAM|nr:hypothetical protein DFH94DRAFT_846757 [Russula ochroleuca]KAF8474537.1 hypothetical protein DFH94DRAFT_806460 [Russula ochroleuca]
MAQQPLSRTWTRLAEEHEKTRMTSTTPAASSFNIQYQHSSNSGNEDGEDIVWGIVNLMRLWRHDVLVQHLYDIAVFWSDKVLSWTLDDPNAAWIARMYSMTHRYSRAERLLTRPFFTKPLAVPFGEKGRAREAARACLSFSASYWSCCHDRHRGRTGASRLVDTSVICRYLAAQCLGRQRKCAEAIEMLGEANLLATGLCTSFNIMAFLLPDKTART